MNERDLLTRVAQLEIMARRFTENEQRKARRKRTEITFDPTFGIGPDEAS